MMHAAWNHTLTHRPGEGRASQQAGKPTKTPKPSRSHGESKGESEEKTKREFVVVLQQDIL